MTKAKVINPYSMFYGQIVTVIKQTYATHLNGAWDTRWLCRFDDGHELEFWGNNLAAVQENSKHV